MSEHTENYESTHIEIESYIEGARHRVEFENEKKDQTNKFTIKFLAGQNLVTFGKVVSIDGDVEFTKTGENVEDEKIIEFANNWIARVAKESENGLEVGMQMHKEVKNILGLINFDEIISHYVPHVIDELSPLRTGNYYGEGVWYNQRLIVEGPRVAIKDSFGNLRHTITEMGNFGQADPEIVEATGQDFYNMKFSIPEIGNTKYGVVSQDGDKITMKDTDDDHLFMICHSIINISHFLKDTSIFELKWITQEEADALDADGDPMEAPPCPYKIQPNNLGKLIWITGHDARSGQLLSRNAGYVYYDSDIFNLCKNPYVPAEAPEPSTAHYYQRNLIGEGLEARKKAHQKVTESFPQLIDGSREFDIEDFEEYFGLMCQDIKKERKRIGGDWVVASQVMMSKREERDFMRSCLGPDLVFVVLRMEEAELKKRLLKRQEGDATLDDAAFKMMMAFNKMADPVGDDEENALQVMVTHDTTMEDLANNILQMLQQFKKDD